MRSRKLIQGEAEALLPQSCTRKWPTLRSSNATDALEQCLEFCYGRWNRLHPEQRFELQLGL